MVDAQWIYNVGDNGGIQADIPSGSQMWLAGKSPNEMDLSKGRTSIQCGPLMKYRGL